MKSELKRLLQKSESVLLSKDSNMLKPSYLVFMLPETERTLLAQFADDIVETFSEPSTILFKGFKANMYDCDLVVNGDNCVIGQLSVDNFTLNDLQSLALPVQLSFRVAEKVKLSIDDMEEATAPATNNEPLLRINTVGEATIQFV